LHKLKGHVELMKYLWRKTNIFT